MARYTISQAYKLGDCYKESYQWLAAELCYSLPLIKDHPYNSMSSKEIDKLNQFIAFRNANASLSALLKPTDMPAEALQLHKSFYSFWLNSEIKQHLIERSETHTTKRWKTIIELFNKVTSKFDNIGDLDIDDIKDDVLAQHGQYIHSWTGPRFSKLQYKKNSTTLTVVMTKKDYRKRCMNSQEDWFKKYDGVFFARCLQEIVQTLQARLSHHDFELAAVIFVRELLLCKIQFDLAAAKLLLPAGTLFGCDALMDVFLQFHPKLEAKRIKKESYSKRKRDCHKMLLKICQDQYRLMVCAPVVHSNHPVQMNTVIVKEEPVSNTNQMQCGQMCSFGAPFYHPIYYPFNAFVQQYPSQPMFDPHMMLPYAPQIHPSPAMTGETGSVCTICTECGEQQCLCSSEDSPSTTQNMNLNDGHRLFQATEFPTQMHRNLRHAHDHDRHQRVSLHIDAMRNMNTPQAIHPMFGNVHSQQ
eukprot:21897_1